MSDGAQKPITRCAVLAPDFDELAQARRFVAEVAVAAGFDEGRVFDITVAVSEAAANAIEHVPVRGEVTLTTHLYPDRLEIQVQGPGEFQAPHRLEGGGKHRGLGLPLMAQFADHLALYSGPSGGTLVSLTFYLPGRRPVGDAAVPPSIWQDGAPVGALVVGHDVTERTRAEQVTIGSEEKYRRILDSMTEGFCVIEMLFDDAGTAVDWRYLEANPAFYGQTGLDESAMGKRISELIPGLDPVWFEFYETVLRTGVHGHLQQEVRLWDAWYEVDAFKMGGEGEPLLGVLFKNVTDKILRENNLMFLSDVERLLSGHLIAAEVVPRVGEMLGEALAVDNFLIAEAAEGDSEGKVLYAWRHERAVDLLSTHSLTELNGPGYWEAMRGGIAWVVSDTATDARTNAARHAEFGVRAYIVVPLDRDSRWKYLVSVDSATPRQWTAAEVDLVKEVANRVVTRVERAQAEEELRASEESYRLLAQENERLYRQQLDIAEHLQQTLLHIPSEIGRVRLGHLYRSATEAARVGGDFYDVFEAMDDHIAILMGDVAGHGVQAARTGTLVKDVVHAFTHQSLRTNEVLRRTNLLLIEKDLPDFVTLFLAVLDPDTGVLRYSSAGHPESMIKRASGEIEMLGCGSSPLGIYPEASWKPREIRLAPGDLLLLYTDGVTEARRGAELFGEGRLEKLLRRKRVSPARLPHMVLDQVLAFSGGSLNDDAAVLALTLVESEDGASPRSPAQQKLIEV